MTDTTPEPEQYAEKIIYIEPMEAAFRSIMELANPTFQNEEQEGMFIEAIQDAILTTAKYSINEAPMIAVWIKVALEPRNLDKSEYSVACIPRKLLEKLTFQAGDVKEIGH